ncbi:hypothetical protein KY317_03380 [Candidatus Woesearchaeota archaeon]|nr:hypothetical protein [Candidatus Woesearchaeota archaeon]
MTEQSGLPVTDIGKNQQGGGMLSRKTQRTEKTVELKRLQTKVCSVTDIRNKIIAQTQKLTRDYENGLVDYGKYSKSYDRLLERYSKYERKVSEHKQGIKQIQRENRRPVVIASIIIALMLVGLLSIFGNDLISGLATYGQQEQYQAMGTVKLWNNTFNTTGQNITGAWQVYLKGAADWFYTNLTADRNFTLNTKPHEVNLSWPANNTAITDRYTNFTWYNASDAENDTLTYNLVVDDDINFGSPVIDVSNIAEGPGSIFTNYTSTVELSLSTIYYWKVRAYDTEVYSDFSEVWNFSITPYKAINLIIANVSFGSMINGSNTTEDHSPPPVIVENVGNVPVNLTFNGSALWTSVAAENDYYMFKAGVNESNSFDETLSDTTWTQVPLSSATPQIIGLNYTNENNTVEIEINLTVPPDEGAGTKSADILISS